MIDVAMWMSRKRRAKRETLRCSDWERKRGHRGDVQRTLVTSPSATDAVSSTSAVNPLPRVAYQNGVGPSAAAAITAALLRQAIRSDAARFRRTRRDGLESRAEQATQEHPRRARLQPLSRRWHRRTMRL